jgi:hypothetical protein
MVCNGFWAFMFRYLQNSVTHTDLLAVGGQMGARRVFKMGPYGLRTSPSNKGLKKSSTSTMDSISGLRRQDTNLGM